MTDTSNSFETLKQILRSARDPKSLDDHPWARSLIVQEAVRGSAQLQDASPGQQLVSTIVDLFPQLQPSAPPRRGKRLDPRWGEFGLLAALYFTPFNHGTPFPTTLMEAWGRIDPAILHFVYGETAGSLPEEQVRRYQLVGSDLEYGSASTLSDWHKKGLQRLTEILLNRERFLSRSHSTPSIILEPDEVRSLERSRSARIRRRVGITLTLAILLVLGLGAWKGWRIYERGITVYRDVTELRSLLGAPIEIETVDHLVPVLTRLQVDLSLFKEEAWPAIWLSPRLKWIPVYGNDLASAPDLIELAEHLLEASLISLQAAQPLLDGIDSEISPPGPAGLTARLVHAQPMLEEARRKLDQALAVRESLAPEEYSPRLQGLLVDDIDPLLTLAEDGLSLATALPGILGAGRDGPKTYLLLVQNEDELRPTGGFITSVGNLVLHNGQVISLEFESVDSEVQEDWSRPYPAAPWQLQEYMNSRVLILRDSNWFSDFPTSAMWAEYLYAYTHDHSVDGVIAFDQHFLVMLLGEIGPLEVEDTSYPLTGQNVIEYMRQAKIRPTDPALAADWYRKEFISTIADSILMELNGGDGRDWRALAQVLTRALAERHLLLQFDDPDVAALTAERGWDNAVRAEGGDYLLVTDTNIGFNKTSTVVDVSLTYDVDLTRLSEPEGTLTVSHTNNANSDVPCVHWNDNGQITGEKSYPINRCYWTYLRAYKQAGVELLEATPHAIPGDWMLFGRGVPARVDTLEEDLAGIQGFGTLLVVPGGEALQTRFQFALPESVLLREDASKQVTYRLHVQKQPGTLAHPLVIRVHLPNGAQLVSTSLEAVIQEDHLLIETDLRTDVELEVVFTLP